DVAAVDGATDPDRPGWRGLHPGDVVARLEAFGQQYGVGRGGWSSEDVENPPRLAGKIAALLTGLDLLRIDAGMWWLSPAAGRWRLVGAGLSNVWRFGDLILDAASGRLLLRGPNGTGKTTALEALWPYLLDLNAQRLAAGKARPTSLASLMREGATGKRRYG